MSLRDEYKMPRSVSKTSKVGHWATVGQDWTTIRNGPLFEPSSLQHKDLRKVGHDFAGEVGTEEENGHALRRDTE